MVSACSIRNALLKWWTNFQSSHTTKQPISSRSFVLMIFQIVTLEAMPFLRHNRLWVRPLELIVLAFKKFKSIRNDYAQRFKWKTLLSHIWKTSKKSNNFRKRKNKVRRKSWNVWTLSSRLELQAVIIHQSRPWCRDLVCLLRLYISKSLQNQPADSRCIWKMIDITNFTTRENNPYYHVQDAMVVKETLRIYSLPNHRTRMSISYQFNSNSTVLETHHRKKEPSFQDSRRASCCLSSTCSRRDRLSSRAWSSMQPGRPTSLQLTWMSLSPNHIYF